MMICWNCRGMGSSSAIQQLKDLTKQINADVVCLMETMVQEKKLRGVQKSLGLKNGIFVDPVGKSGGLAVLYKDGIHMEPIHRTNHVITGKFTDYLSSKSWIMSIVYGHPVSSRRKIIWDFLRDFKTKINDPWVLWGDFNSILRFSEKEGGNINRKSMLEFNDLVSDLNLIDLGYKGCPYTWGNNRKGGNFIRERLDRVLCTDEWFNIFPRASVTHLVTCKSDHKALLLNCLGNPSNTRRPFRFMSVWSKSQDCETLIDKKWNSSELRDTPNLSKKLEKLSWKLKTWNKKSFGNIFQKIKSLKKDIENLEGKTMSDSNIDLLREKKRALEEVYDQESDYWKQHSRTKWKLEGNRNTKFFHLTANMRRRKNTIEKLKRDNGTWADNREEIGNELIHYFKNLLQSEETCCSIDILNLFNPCISDRDNESLTRIPNDDEIHNVIKKFGSTKAPGPDGYQALFYQKYWHIVGSDVTSLVQIFFRMGYVSNEINLTYITLIPKIKNPQNPKDFRPISLCNVIYKILTKIIANRLKPLLRKFISPFQGAFAPGRSIGDNVGLVHEVMHKINKLKKKDKGWYTLKLDMAKAYDRIEWGTLEKVLLKLGFSVFWVSLVKYCVSSASFQILLNGEPLDAFQPSRGLRQGDPLSPYLFIIVGEILSRLLCKAEEDHLISGFHVARNAPSINHLLYADDLIIFGKASLDESRKLKSILDIYCKATGQKINYDKSRIHLSKWIHHRHKKLIRATLGVQFMGEKEKYLGNPLLLSKSKVTDFSFLEDKLKDRLIAWKASVLSQAGRGVMIQAVAAALPIYNMSTYKIPKTICERLDSLCSNFWWNGTDSSKSLHLVSWPKLCKPKREGGMGFRLFWITNHAMLAKLFWKAIVDRKSLWARVMRAKYKNFFNLDTSFDLPNNSSYLVRGLIKAKEIILSGAVWTIGSGSTISFWNDPWLWINDKPCRLKDFFPDWVVTGEKVNNYLDGTGKWITYKLDRFPEPIRQSILDTHPRVGIRDRLRWTWSNNGRFSVKSAIRIARNLLCGEASTSNHVNHIIWNRVWNLKIPADLKLFIWKLFSNSLPTAHKLTCFHANVDPYCTFCEKEIENMDHLFFKCEWARRTWFSSSLGLKMENYTFQNEKWFEMFLKMDTNDNSNMNSVLAFYILYHMWLERNNARFEKKWPNIMDVIQKAVFDRQVWLDALSLMEPPTTRQPDIQQEQWIAPPPGWFKINVDASFQGEKRSGIAAAVCRNENGRVLGACTKKVRAKNAEEAEAHAAELGCLLAIRLELEDIILEGDCQNVFQALNGHESVNWNATNMIEQCLLVSSHFRTFLACHCPRTCNKLAHNLASKVWEQGLFSETYYVEPDLFAFGIMNESL